MSMTTAVTVDRYSPQDVALWKAWRDSLAVKITGGSGSGYYAVVTRQSPINNWRHREARFILALALPLNFAIPDDVVSIQTGEIT